MAKIVTHSGHVIVLRLDKQMVDILEWVNKVDGFPIQIEGHGATIKITHIKQESIPESQFSVLAGYTKANEMHQGANNESTGKGK